jgi:hypothetical protein
MRKAVEVEPDGKRVYRKRYKQVRKSRSEWVGVPIPDAEIRREWVDAAREAIKDNKRPSNSGRRFWPLSGGILRCPTCGWSMCPHTLSRGGKSTKTYYYRCSNHMKSSYDGCSNYRHYRAEELEEEVWQAVRSLLRNPQRLRTGMDAVIEMHRSALRGSPGREVKAWLDKLAEVDRKWARYQEMATEKLITLDELREKLAGLGEIRTTAERALEEVRGRAGRIIELERDRDALLASYEVLALKELDDLSPEERHDVYRWLRMTVYAHPEGTVEVTGEFLPFGAQGSDNPPDDAPGRHGSDPGSNGGGYATRGFSTNINTRAYARDATVRRAPATPQRPVTSAGRIFSRPLALCPGPPQAARQACGDGTSGTCRRSSSRGP